MQSIDILAFGAHPDDVEISAGGTVLHSIAQGKSVVIADLTRGELGSRGSGELRLEEARRASELMGLHDRVNLGLADGFFRHEEESIRSIIGVVRRYKPRIVLANSVTDRHPDHGRAAQLVREACFYSGLRRIDTGQEAWRPQAVYHFIQDYHIAPHFVVDVTPYWEKKIEVLKAYSSQFYDPSSAEPETPISGREFFEFLRARAMDLGRPAGCLLAEGFTVNRAPAVDDLFHVR